MTDGTMVQEQEVGSPASACQHHWLIETPRGAISRGYCKRCGAEREFRNSATDYLWEDDPSHGYDIWRGLVREPKATDDDEVAAVPRVSGLTLVF